MAEIIHAGETPQGEDVILIYGLDPDRRWNVTLTYPSGAQQHYGCTSNSIGILTLTHPVYEAGDVFVQCLPPTAPRQVEEGALAIQAHERPQNKRAPAHVPAAEREKISPVLADELSPELEEKVIEKRGKTAEGKADEIAVPRVD